MGKCCCKIGKVEEIHKNYLRNMLLCNSGIEGFAQYVQDDIVRFQQSEEVTDTGFCKGVAATLLFKSKH